MVYTTCFSLKYQNGHFSLFGLHPLQTIIEYFCILEWEMQIFFLLPSPGTSFFWGTIIYTVCYRHLTGLYQQSPIKSTILQCNVHIECSLTFKIIWCIFQIDFNINTDNSKYLTNPVRTYSLSQPGFSHVPILPTLSRGSFYFRFRTLSWPAFRCQRKTLKQI